MSSRRQKRIHALHVLGFPPPPIITVVKQKSRHVKDQLEARDYDRQAINVFPQKTKIVHDKFGTRRNVPIFSLEKFGWIRKKKGRDIRMGDIPLLRQGVIDHVFFSVLWLITFYSWLTRESKRFWKGYQLQLRGDCTHAVICTLPQLPTNLGNLWHSHDC